jgi:hypothetical protein
VIRILGVTFLPNYDSGLRKLAFIIVAKLVKDGSARPKSQPLGFPGNRESDLKLNPDSAVALDRKREAQPFHSKLESSTGASTER